MVRSTYQKIIQSRLRKPIGVLFVVLGFFALVTPFTPGSWLAFIGLELLGARFLLDRFVGRMKRLFHRKKREYKNSGQSSKPSLDSTANESAESN